MKKENHLVLILLIVVVCLLNVDQNIMNATLGSIEAEFNITDADIGIMSALFTVFGALISIIWGYLSDKRNRKHLFIFAVIFADAACFFTAFSQNYSQFLECIPGGN